jgi:hypothetical protein
MEATMTQQEYDYLYEAIRASADTPKGYRLGQALFNALPTWATPWIAGSSFDPFHKDMSDAEAFAWIQNHLIFDEYGLLAVYNGYDTIVAERPDDGRV